MEPSNLLETDEDKFIQNLMLQQAAASGIEPQLDPSPSQAIVPQPGFCLKTKDVSGKKVFINVCHSEKLPKARSITDEELIELLESDDPGGYRVPMSLGEPHAEVDNHGVGCTAYDIVVNPEFFNELEKRQVLLGFLLTVVLEGLEFKYEISLSREWKILKNKKFIGSLPEQNVRTKSKPFIMEMDSQGENKSSLISEIDSPKQNESKKKAPEPPYTIVQEPASGHPEFLVADIHMPKVKSVATMTLDVGEDHILLQTRSNIYGLDIYLPYDIIQEDVGAQFNKKTKILTLTMPVVPR